MNKSEEELYYQIIENIDYNKRMNKCWLYTIGWNKKSSDFIKLQECWLYRKEYTYLDYLDWRKNLIEIPNFCKYSWKKISKEKIKQQLNNYFNN